MTVTPGAHPVLHCAEKLIQAHREVTRALNEILRDTGLNISDCRILGILRSNPYSALSVDQVARRADLHRTSVGATLEHLETFGLASRDRSESDLRRIDLRLTKYGESRLAAAEAVLETFTASGLCAEVQELWSLASVEARPAERTLFRA